MFLPVVLHNKVVCLGQQDCLPKSTGKSVKAFFINNYIYYICT